MACLSDDRAQDWQLWVQRERASPAHPGDSLGLLLLCGPAGQPGTILKPRGPKWARAGPV